MEEHRDKGYILYDDGTADLLLHRGEEEMSVHIGTGNVDALIKVLDHIVSMARTQHD